MRKLLYIIGIVLLWQSSLSATTYYINYNAAAGGDGTTTATTGANCAFDRLADVSSVMVNGDIFYLNRGDQWRELITVSAPNITIDAYGTGVQPKINGCTIFTGWTLDNGTVYKKTVSLIHPNNYRNSVFYNDVRLTMDGTKTTTLGLNTWNYASGVLWVNVGEDPATHDLEATTCYYGVYNNTVANSGLIVQNINFVKGAYAGVWDRAPNAYIANNTFTKYGHESGSGGILYLIGSADYSTLIGNTFIDCWSDQIYISSCDYVSILQNNLYICYGTDNTHDNIQTTDCNYGTIIGNYCDLRGATCHKQNIMVGTNVLSDGGHGFLIKGNRCLGNSAGGGSMSGICSESSDTIIEENYIEGGQGAWGGVGLQAPWSNITTSNVIIRNNVIRNTYNGIVTDTGDSDQTYRTGIEIYNNTLINCANKTFDFWRTTATVKNNILIQEDGNQFFDIDVSTITSDYNCYDTNFSNMFNLEGTPYATLVAWRAASGGDANSVVANPNLTSVYRPTSTTPNGVVLSDVATDFNQSVRDATTTMGAIEYGWTLCQ